MVHEIFPSRKSPSFQQVGSWDLVAETLSWQQSFYQSTDHVAWVNGYHGSTIKIFPLGEAGVEPPSAVEVEIPGGVLSAVR